MKALTKENLDKLVIKRIEMKKAERDTALNSSEFKTIEAAEFHRLWVVEEMSLEYAKYNAALKAAHEMGYDHHRKASLLEEFKWTREVLNDFPAYVMHAYYEDKLWTPAVQKRWDAEDRSL